MLLSPELVDPALWQRDPDGHILAGHLAPRLGGVVGHHHVCADLNLGVVKVAESFNFKLQQKIYFGTHDHGTDTILLILELNWLKIERHQLGEGCAILFMPEFS